jgi:hypothetical protein
VGEVGMEEMGEIKDWVFGQNTGGKMEKLDFARMLLESSFKEANLFWMRNGAFSVFQSILAGSGLLSWFKDSNPKDASLVIFISIIGILIGIIHFAIICTSEKLNKAWWYSFNHYFKTFRKSENLSIEYECLEKIASQHQNLDGCCDVFFLSKFIPIFFGLLWAIILLNALH